MEDISWPSPPIETVSCTACVLSRGEGAEGRRRREEEEEEEEARRVRKEVLEENLTTTTLTVGKNSMEA